MGNQKEKIQRRRFRRINKGLSIVLLFLILSVSGFSAKPTHLYVRQAYAELPKIVAYVDILDKDGNGVGGITKAQISATLGTEPTMVQRLEPFKNTGEGTAYIVLVDISKTLREKEFKQIRKSLAIWIDNMNAADRMAVLTFGDGYKELINFSADKSALKDRVNELRARDNNTHLYKALDAAMEQYGQRGDEGLPIRRVIVVLSDGKDEGSGINESAIKEEIEKHHIPIYAIGYSRLKSGERQRFLDVLKRFSSDSGGIYEEAQENNLQAMYTTIQDSILRVYRLELSCDTFQGDNKRHRLQVDLKSEERLLRNGIDVMVPPKYEPPPPPPPPPPPTQKIPTWVYIAGIGVLLLAVILFIVFRKKKREFPEERVTEFIGDREGETIIPGETPVAGDSFDDEAKKDGIPIQLIEVGGKGRARKYDIVLVDSAVVGRKENCDVVLENDMDVSREHFELVFENGGVLIRDLGATHGTLVNGVPITSRYRLESGDIILAGRTQLRILFERGKS